MMPIACEESERLTHSDDNTDQEMSSCVSQRSSQSSLFSTDHLINNMEEDLDSRLSISIPSSPDLHLFRQSPSVSQNSTSTSYSPISNISLSFSEMPIFFHSDDSVLSDPENQPNRAMLPLPSSEMTQESSSSSHSTVYDPIPGISLYLYSDDSIPSMSSIPNQGNVIDDDAEEEEEQSVEPTSSAEPRQIPRRSHRTQGLPALAAASASGSATSHALQVANRIIKYARDNKTIDDYSIRCPNCSHFPLLPVTGPCGHTRCTICIQFHGACPCGVQAPKDLHVNTLIQELLRKMLPNASAARVATKEVDVTSGLSSGTRAHNCLLAAESAQRAAGQGAGRLRRRPARPFTAATPGGPPYMSLSPQTHFELGSELLTSRRYYQAAPHLARAAASGQPLSRIARSMLTQAITALSDGRDPRRLTRQLYGSVRVQSASQWLRAADLECVLCYSPYSYPVTTPCGHNYCRSCIERTMDYKKACALCQRPLDQFNLNLVNENVFLSAALASIDAVSLPAPPEPDVISIFVCTVAYPFVSCPLFIFDPRYWMMIRRVLESGSRKFGMVVCEQDRIYSNYGTVLEVCDCVHLEDGRSILSTVGVSRFRVIERHFRDGCDVARIQCWTDIVPTNELAIWELRIFATQTWCKSVIWLNRMERGQRAEIETAFGAMPPFAEDSWWLAPDGPAWLWWLIAILPLRTEVKVLILSTKSLLKRVMAVSCTLDSIDQVSTTRAGAAAAAQAADWELSALSDAAHWLDAV